MDTVAGRTYIIAIKLGVNVIHTHSRWDHDESSSALKFSGHRNHRILNAELVSVTFLHHVVHNDFNATHVIQKIGQKFTLLIDRKSILLLPPSIQSNHHHHRRQRSNPSRIITEKLSPLVLEVLCIIRLCGSLAVELLPRISVDGGPKAHNIKSFTFHTVH